MRLLVSEVFADDANLDITRASLKINFARNISQDVILKVYSGNHAAEDYSICESNVFTIRDQITYLKLIELFSSATYKISNTELAQISFQLIDADTDMQLGFYSITIIQANKTEGNRGGSNSRFGIHGNVSYQINHNSEQVDTSINPSFQALEINNEIDIYGVPLAINALVTDFKDPILNYNLSNFTSYFDVNEWKERQKAKVAHYAQNEVSKAYSQIPNYKSLIKKNDHLSRVLSNPSLAEDIDNIEEMIRTYDTLGLSNREEIERKLYQEYRELKSLERESKLDTITSVQDSMNVLIDKVKHRVDQVHSLKEMYDKKDSYKNLISLRDSTSQILSKANEVQGLMEKYENKILNSPQKINQLLSENEKIKTYEKLLNYVTDLRYGNINPQYSKHVLRGNRNQGISFGVGGEAWDLHMFKSNLIGRNVSIISDTMQIIANELVGAKLEMNYGEYFSNKAFIIRSISEDITLNDLPKALIGYGFKIKKEKQKITFETVWSQKDSKTAENREGLEKISANVALDFSYERKLNKDKVKWVSEVSYVAPEFYDFNNPFQFRNHIKGTSKLQWKVSNSYKTSFNVFAQKANVWGNTTSLNHRLLIGMSHLYNKRDYPTVNYSLQYGLMDIEGNSVRTQMHNLSSFYNYSVNEKNLTSTININYVSNESKFDSLGLSNFYIANNNTIQLSAIFGVSLGGTVSMFDAPENDQQLDYTIELSLPITYRSMYLNMGMKQLKINATNELGWFCQFRYSVNNKFSINLNLDSQQRSNYIDEFGIVRDRNFGRYTGTANYNF